MDDPMSEILESNIWWVCGQMCGVDSETAYPDGTVVSSCVTHLEDHIEMLEELTEADFAAMLRAKFVGERDQYQVRRAVQQAALDDFAVERAAQIAELVGTGLSEATAETLVGPMPNLPGPDEFTLPHGTEAFLAAAYRLSPESIAVVLAPFET